ncbi:MAG: hypothetical protein COT43_02225 [Candidatus Marinimicrobia bacterium CG08_land_8_20_14_0_20_45_22]|nr:MAG: hypothetical protein COT43_02225 [Candidatus Marinimicrobia bacterium CG08_land_8_20_14_0_20_45_22]
MKRVLIAISIFFFTLTFFKTIFCQEHNQFFWINNQNNNFDYFECQGLESDCMWFCLRWTNYYADTENKKINVNTIPGNQYPWRLSSLDEEVGAAKASLNAWNSIVKDSKKTPFIDDEYNNVMPSTAVWIVNLDNNSYFYGGSAITYLAINDDYDTDQNYTFVYYNSMYPKFPPLM